MTSRILFVCTGNTCRSPMATRLFRHAVETDPTCQGVQFEARSAGISARDGEAATALAMAALRGRGLDLSDHRATRFSPEAAAWADVILTMTAPHKETVVRRAPAARSKTFTITEYAGQVGDVSDPLVERTPDAYERCAARLTRLMPAVVARLSRSAHEAS